MGNYHRNTYANMGPQNMGYRGVAHTICSGVNQLTSVNLVTPANLLKTKHLALEYLRVLSKT